MRPKRVLSGRSWTCCLLTAFVTLALPASATTRNVPAQYATIQAAIDASVNGDVVLIAPGTYIGSPTLSGKTITVASLFLTTGNRAYIGQTILDGGGAGWAFQVLPCPGLPSVVGLTLRNGDDGLRATGHFQFLDCRATGNTDGSDYDSGAGGVIRRCVFEGNGDDGIDINNEVDVVIEDCTIQDNGDDGIEIRMQDISGPALALVLQRNTIARNDEDGIQLIGYDVLTDRTLRIERNLFLDNRMVGVGMMCCSNTVEDYQGASLPERIDIVHNTFSGNNYGITGGDSTVVVDNLFVHTTNLALKNVNAGSVAAYNVFFANGTNQSQSIVDGATTVLADPLLQPNWTLGAGSPAIDAGTALFSWNGRVRWQEPASAYVGAAPDPGVFEYGSSVSVLTDGAPGVRLRAPAPNPGRGAIALGADLATAGHVRLEIVDLQGRLVRALVDDFVPAGRLDRVWDGRSDRGELTPPGLFWVRLVTAEGACSRRFARIE
jgi:hypothetical protein